MLELIDLNNLNRITINRLLNGAMPVAFLGSGISLFFPSGLPSGKVFSSSVFEFLFGSIFHPGMSGKGFEFEDILRKLPFEIINERCPVPLVIDELLKGIYTSEISNPVHELFAELLSEGKIKSIITPNYDCCLDSALLKYQKYKGGWDNNPGFRVINETDTKHISSTYSPSYFKIHGSVDDPSGESLIFRLNQEGILPVWKRLLFRNIVENETLLIIGYSGSDFDICPEIMLAKPRKIIWNLFTKDEFENSINIKHLSESIDIYGIYGDMGNLLSSLYFPIDLKRDNSRFSLIQLLNKNIDSKSRALWQIRVLNSICYNNLSINVVEQEIKLESDSMQLISLMSEYAGALASSGRYKDAAKTHDHASRLALNKEKLLKLSSIQTLLACDAWRCYGSLFQSLFRLYKVEKRFKEGGTSDTELEMLILRNRILILRHPYNLMKKLHIKIFTSLIKNKVGDYIHKTATYYRNCGEWHQLQQIELWRDKFDLDRDTTVFESEYLAPVANDGYIQLNFPMGRMMAFRAEIIRKKQWLSTDDNEIAKKYLDDAVFLGIYPEVWKLYYILFFKNSLQNRKKNTFGVLFTTFTNVNTQPFSAYGD